MNYGSLNTFVSVTIFLSAKSMVAENYKTLKVGKPQPYQAGTKQNMVGAAPCGRPQNGQPRGVAPTVCYHSTPIRTLQVVQEAIDMGWTDLIGTPLGKRIS